MMSSPIASWTGFTVANAVHVLAVVLLALLANWLLRQLTAKVVQPASSPARAAQTREQQTRELAASLYGVASKAVWCVAILMALPEFGIGAWPVVVLAGLAVLALGLGAQNTVRDFIAGYYIVLEDQFAGGDTIQIGSVTGRVEQFTLRRTLLRDKRGALVTLANGDLRAVANLSRDWSQAFVDVAVAAHEPLERTLQALESAAADLRADSSWAQALVDGPRVLGIQAYGPAGSTLRLQVRTAPTRQDEVSRELRRRIQLEFQRHNVSLATVEGIDRAAAFHALEEAGKPDSAD